MSSARCRGRADLSEATLKRLLEEEGGNKESRRSPQGKKVQGPGQGSTTKVRKKQQGSAQPLWKAGGYHDRTKRGREVSCQPPRFFSRQTAQGLSARYKHETPVMSSTVQRSWGARFAFLKNAVRAVRAGGARHAPLTQPYLHTLLVRAQ